MEVYLGAEEGTDLESGVAHRFENRRAGTDDSTMNAPFLVSTADDEVCVLAGKTVSRVGKYTGRSQSGCRLTCSTW